MLIISTLAALEAAGDASLRPLLADYAGMTDLATIFVVEPGDTYASLDAARGHLNCDWEFVLDRGGWFEAVTIISDDGAGHVVFVPDRPEIDPALLAHFREWQP